MNVKMIDRLTLAVNIQIGDGDMDMEASKDFARGIAAAVLDCLKQPTDKMVLAAFGAGVKGVEFEAAWRAAIDSILREQSC